MVFSPAAAQFQPQVSYQIRHILLYYRCYVLHCFLDFRVLIVQEESMLGPVGQWISQHAKVLSLRL